LQYNGGFFRKTQADIFDFSTVSVKIAHIHQKSRRFARDKDRHPPVLATIGKIPIFRIRFDPAFNE
jgi:hypothetical protein